MAEKFKTTNVVSEKEATKDASKWIDIIVFMQGRNHGKNLGATSAMVGRICPPGPGSNRVKVSQNLGATTVAPVAPVDTSL